EIVNILGQHVRTLVDNEIKAGVREVKWNSRNDFGVSVSTGIYFYRIKAGSFIAIKKLTLIK
ncbi:MAG: T9SS type A sorting domain-containing protein, partial [Candidatus Anammoxibacter sp.]